MEFPLSSTIASAVPALGEGAPTTDIETTYNGLHAIRAAAERARSDTRAPADVVLAILAIYQAHIELAAGSVYAQQERTQGAIDCFRRAKRCADRQVRGAFAAHPDVRTALGVLQRGLASIPGIEALDPIALAESEDGWTVDAECIRFRRPGGEWVSLARRHALRRIAFALVNERLARPGSAVPQMDLIEAGWPGERTLRTAALNRFHFSLVCLRKLGWADILQTRQQAYRLDPNMPLVLLGAPPMDLSA
jgi:hypothetical protein